MNEKIQAFTSHEFGSLDILVEDDKVYFPATECAKILGYSQPIKAIKRHSRWGMKRTVPHPQNPSKLLEINYIPEGDLYRLIVRSKLPTAEKFEHWVFDDVLPIIRKYGIYATNTVLEQMIAKPEFAISMLQEIKNERDKRMTAEKENLHNLALITAMESKLTYYDEILKNPLSIPVSKIAKDYGMSAIAFNRMLNAKGLQFPFLDTWLLYAKYQDQGYTHSYTHSVNHKKAVVQTNWTQKGKLFLYEFLKENGISPMIERRTRL